MEQRKVLSIIGYVGKVLCFLVLLKLRTGIYKHELPSIGLLLIIGLLCLFVADKFKVVRGGGEGAVPTLSEKWKCSCGAYNNPSDLYCQYCGTKKLSS